MDISKLKNQYDSLCKTHIDLFCKKNDVEFYFWVGDEVGGTACFNHDFFFNFTDIILDIHTMQPANKIFEWDAYNENHPHYISYEAYCNGARHEAEQIFNF